MSGGLARGLEAALTERERRWILYGPQSPTPIRVGTIVPPPPRKPLDGRPTFFRPPGIPRNWWGQRLPPDADRCRRCLAGETGAHIFEPVESPRVHAQSESRSLSESEPLTAAELAAIRRSLETAFIQAGEPEVLEFRWANEQRVNGMPTAEDLEREGWTKVRRHPRWYRSWLMRRLSTSEFKRAVEDEQAAWSRLRGNRLEEPR